MVTCNSLCGSGASLFCGAKGHQGQRKSPRKQKRPHLTQPATAPAPKWLRPIGRRSSPKRKTSLILMPKDTTTEIAPFEYHKFQLNTRLYMSAPAAGPIVGVASMRWHQVDPGLEFRLRTFQLLRRRIQAVLPAKGVVRMRCLR